MFSEGPVDISLAGACPAVIRSVDKTGPAPHRLLGLLTHSYTPVLPSRGVG